MTEDFAALHDSLVVCRDTAWADTRCKSSVSLTSDACYCRLGIEPVAVLHNSSFSLVHHPDAACMITKQESLPCIKAAALVCWTPLWLAPKACMKAIQGFYQNLQQLIVATIACAEVACTYSIVLFICKVIN